MSFNIKENNIYLDNRKVFLLSGEIHYFRIRRELWDKHLAAAKEAGLIAVSTYVPWAWHESEEGAFDFDGITHPERDLKGWLQKCKIHGLKCIVKPGPFILAEFRGAGLPDWFVEKYASQVKMRTRKGDIVPSDGVNLFHPIFIEKVGLWFDQIMPLIAEREISNGGPLIMMQICNEIGVFSWLAHQADYGLGVKERFIRYLQKKFKSIQELNRLWETDYVDFQQVELPPDGRLPFVSKSDRSRDHEWHLFWRNYYGDYLRMLSKMARDRGVTVPFYHNLPGWIYGHGYEFPVNITMYEDLFEDKSDIIFGVDHIPEFLSHRNLHDDRIINDITFAMQGSKPLFAAEFQSGSREYHVVTNPREMELFYKASVANGLTGWNYYMFSQGRNPRRKGYSGDTFYWFNPLTPEAEQTSAFPLVKRMNEIIKTAENIVVDAQRKAEVCVLFYPPYYATELERPEEGGSGLVFNAPSIRRAAYFDGLLKVLQIINIDYVMADLSKVSAGDLQSYKQVWAFSTDEMNAKDQKTIADYARAGGNLVIFPFLPDRELSQNPCTLLRDELGIEPSGTETIDSPLIDVFDLKDIKCANPQVIYNEEKLAGATPIARTIAGSVCGFEKSLGSGTVLHLGTWIGFDTEGHKPVYQAILDRSQAKLRQATSSGDYVSVRERFTKDGSAVLFIGNYYNEEQTAKITYTHPESSETLPIPFSGGETLFPALYAVLSPVCIPVTAGLKILHSTSDLLQISVNDNDLKITLHGDRDLAGEMVFEGEKASSIQSAELDGAIVKPFVKGQRVCLQYSHLHKKESVLTIKLR